MTPDALQDDERVQPYIDRVQAAEEGAGNANDAACAAE